MPTDFFQRQDAARKNTVVLVVLFLIAVVAIVVATFLAAYWLSEVAAESRVDSRYGRERGVVSEQVEPRVVAFWAAAASLVLILGGSLYKVFELRRGGGQGVAESVGGRRIYPNTTDPGEQRLLNVVEEMAIASGTSVPPVFLLDEDAINAFAAGYSPRDAVIGVTRGANEQLSRDQLQGVIAHEFSHLLNGDMRMNIRMIGILHGILLLTLIGKLLLYSMYFGSGSGSSRRNGGGGQWVLVALALGLLMYALGVIGSLFGGLIKAAVSRQREYLADASAVQFTRNPNGIGGALKQIGAGARNSRIRHANAAEASHMYFAQGVYEGLSGLMATHPPLDKRILAIDPQWDGKFLQREGLHPRMQPYAAASGFAGGDQQAEAAPGEPALAAGLAQGRRSEPAPAAELCNAARRIGNPEALHRLYAAQLLSELDPVSREAAHEPAAARSLVIALLLDADEGIRERQLRAVAQTIEPYAAQNAQKLWRRLRDLPAESRLPLLDMTLPALRSMSESQYAAFSRTIAALVEADERISIFEWTLGRVLGRHLEPQFSSAKSPVTQYYGLRRLSEPVSVLLSTLSRLGGDDEARAANAFAHGAAKLPKVQVRLLPITACTLSALRGALDVLENVSAPKRAQLVDACAAAVCADERVTVAEAELLRGIADLLDCPVPPMVAHTAIQERVES